MIIVHPPVSAPSAKEEVEIPDGVDWKISGVGTLAIVDSQARPIAEFASMAWGWVQRAAPAP